MDGVSAAASVAGIAAAGIQLSKALHDVVITIKAGREEIRDIATNVSLLSSVLTELQDVLDREKIHFRPLLDDNARTIVSRCEIIFKDIEKHTVGRHGKTTPRLVWYFRRERAKPLRASLESLKSTLSILLHVIQLAKTTKEAVDTPASNAADQTIRRGRRGLVYDVIENRIGVFRLKALEEESLRAKLDIDIDDLPFLCDGSSPLPAIFQRRTPSPRESDFGDFADPVPASISPRSEDNERQPSPRQLPSSTRITRSRSQEKSKASAGMTTDGYRAKRQRFARSISPNRSRIEEQHMSENEQIESTRQALISPTASVILGIIPHEQADEDFPSNALSDVDPLEAKAESTVDTLLDRWTYVAPKVFSASQVNNTRLDKTPEIPNAESELNRGWGIFGKKKAEKAPAKPLLGKIFQSAEDKDLPQSHKTASNDPSSDQAGDDRSTIEIPFEMPRPETRVPKTSAREKGSPRREKTSRPIIEPRKQLRERKTIPTNPPSKEDESSRSTESKSSNLPLAYRPYQAPYFHGYNFPTQPQYSYPPYLSPFAPLPASTPFSVSDPISASAPPPVPSPPPRAASPQTAHEVTQAPTPVINLLPIDKSSLDPTATNSDNFSDRSVDTIEKLLTIIERPTLERGAIEAKHRQLEEEVRIKAAVEQSRQQAAAADEAEQNSRPVILQDCLGRRFVFPLEICRSWFVSRMDFLRVNSY